MKVSEMIQQLTEMPKDAEVVISEDEGETVTMKVERIEDRTLVVEPHGMRGDLAFDEQDAESLVCNVEHVFSRDLGVRNFKRVAVLEVKEY